VAFPTEEDRIKKAYRKKALELHPDRNPHDVERCTALFAEIQSAYEILSDPSERSWYDSHRDSILRNDVSDDAGHHPVDVTTSAEVIAWISSFSAKIDQPTFFKNVQGAFRTLAEEEVAAGDATDGDWVEYPDFGGLNDTYESGIVRDFYLAWAGFQTKKSFAWCDMYRYTDAPDRRVKRAMEKENTKAREAARKDFNETVIMFVKFVRKRDPRFTPNSMNETQRVAELLQASKEQAAKQRRENMKKRGEYKEADWARVDSNEKGGEGEDVSAKEEDSADDDDEDIPEMWECIVCKKSFRSQGQMDAHEKSKKHIKAVEQLKRQMRKENKEFDIDRDVRGREIQQDEGNSIPVTNDYEEDDAENEDKPIPDTEKAEHSDIEKPPSNHTRTTPQASPESSSVSHSSAEGEDKDGNDEYVSVSKFQARVLGNESQDEGSEETLPNTLANTTLSSRNSDTDSKSAPKIGKAKEKRAKRAQKSAIDVPENQNVMPPSPLFFFIDLWNM
jgi:DnaJ family protein A protein 5